MLEELLMINNAICVFDSGLGSLSIIRQLRKEMPHENLLYLADKAHFPYGTKHREELSEIITNTIRYLQRYKPKLIIMASITPSVHILDEIKRNVSTPFLGVRPPLKEACRLTKKKHIGIMATMSTINSKGLADQIRKEVPQDILITKINASPVVELVENGTYITNERRTFDVISNLIGDELDEKIDVITLCSTHLPFVKRYLGCLLPAIRFIDPSKMVSRDAKRLLLSNKMLRKSGVGRLEILVSGGKGEFEQIIRRMGIKEPAREIWISS